MPDALIAKAELIADWLDATLLVLREHPRGFADFSPAPLERARFFLRERLLPEVRGGLRLPLVALICGGTNTGKSTIFNALVGRASSPSGGTASLTKRLIASGADATLQALVQERKDWVLLPIDTLKQPERPDSTLYSIDLTMPAGLPLLIDSPDIDSSDQTCHRLTRRGLAFADLLIWVTTQQKYRDDAGIAFLDEALSLTATRFDVFNQALSRHQEALEDMHRTYDSRWPTLERYRFRVDEDRSLSSQDVLAAAAIDPLVVRMREVAREPLTVKIRSLSHGVTCQCELARRQAGEILRRQEEWNKEKTQVQRRLEQHLYTRLRHLRGHDNPLELQAAMIRVIGPKMQTVVGDALHQGIGVIGRTLGRLRGMIFGSGTRALPEPVDLKAKRDLDDLREAREIMETVRSDLFERSRRKAERGHPLFVRLRQSLQKIAFPQGEELASTLRLHLERESDKRLLPIVTAFEEDLESFCR
ncbi:MAG TPA: 50S ribosome-binding GTPase, partial [Candidatus Ozemobacteraceae bacterium]|nr:50S ribosome-binding GTPase [Candidatus Ozemobacteraceae bacterium]